MSTLKRALATAAVAAVPTTMIAPAAATEPVKIFDAATDYGVEFIDLTEYLGARAVGYSFDENNYETVFNEATFVFDPNEVLGSRLTSVYMSDLIGGSVLGSIGKVSYETIYHPYSGDPIQHVILEGLSDPVLSSNGIFDFSAQGYTFEENTLYGFTLSPYYNGTSSNEVMFVSRFDITSFMNGVESPVISANRYGLQNAIPSQDVFVYPETHSEYIPSVDQTVTWPAGRDVSAGYSAYFSVYAAAVPEPDNYAMFLAGLGLVGLAARRRMIANDRGVSAPSIDA